MTRPIALAALVAAALITVPAHAGTKYYFACSGPSKVQNDQTVTWTTTAPAASFATGAGCGSADPGPLSGTQSGQKLDFVGGGEHTGPIQALNVELHSLLLTHTRALRTPGMNVQLTVDGNELLDGEAIVRVVPVASSTNLTEAYRLSIARAPEYDDAGNELPTPPLVAGPGKHTVVLTFTGGFIDYSNIWVWGASEVPAHVEIDPAQLSSPTVNPV